MMKRERESIMTYFYEGEAKFFAKNGSSILFEMDEESGLVETVVMDGNIRGERKE